MTQQQERLWFDVVMEGVFVKGLGPKLSDELKADFQALGVDFARLAPAYSMETVIKGFKAVHQRVFPELTEEEAFAEMGRLSMRGWFDTFVGKALLGVVRLIGVRRSLMRLHLTLGSGNNYLKTTSQLVSPTCIEISLSDAAPSAAYWEGLLKEGAVIAHAHNITMTRVPSAAPAQVFRVEWEENPGP